MCSYIQNSRGRPLVERRVHMKPWDNPNNILTEEEQRILDLLKETQEEINNVHNKYDYATDQKIIDSYIYQLKALHLRYEHLLNQVKKMSS